MKLIDFKDDINDNILRDISGSIKEGNLVIFPTETVYGLGADGLNSKAVSKIFKAKGRSCDNPLILHVSNIDMVSRVAKDINEIEQDLMESFWPGPLTIVLNKKDCVPLNVTGGLNTVAVRFPSNKIANKLIKYSDTPIAAPSANISGKPSGTVISDIVSELGNKVSYIIDEGDSHIGVESTVVKVEEGIVHILRPGYITDKDISSLGYEVVIDKHVLGNVEKNDVIASPGMKYKHYAPDTKCVLVYSDDKDKMINKMKELENSNNAVVITNEKNLEYFKNAISYGSSYIQISHNLFRVLREVDKMNVDLVIIEGVKKSDFGLAIMNRLIRACAYNYIEIE